MSGVQGKREKDTAATIEKMIDPLLTRLGFELVLLQYQRDRGGHVLRLFVDKLSVDGVGGGGITLDDCSEVSREVSALLEVEDPIRDAYHLEVSSPGVDRPLVKEKDFERFSGQKAKVVTHEPINGRRTYHGVLGGVENGEVLITVDGQPLRIPHAAIARANIEYQF